MNALSRNLYVCIMAGGKGERFWPLSRDGRPKQFLRIVGPHSMITETALRNRALVPPSRLLVVTTRAQARSVAHALPTIPRRNIIVEPCGRNTAPCIGLVSAMVARDNQDAVLAVVPADHVIDDTALYVRTIRDAAAMALREQALVTIGIEPQFPETGYGYIVAGRRIARRGPTKFSRVERFVEKPARARAEELIATGRALWNAGMFVFRVSDMLYSFWRYVPALHAALTRVLAAPKSLVPKMVADLYAHVHGISIDYAVMEKAKNVVVAHGPFRWDDVGSWSAVAGHWNRDGAGNVSRGEVAAVESSGCVVANECPGVVGLVGLEDVVVVRTRDALLVCPKSKAQDVKKLVQHLRNSRALRSYTQ